MVEARERRGLGLSPLLLAGGVWVVLVSSPVLAADDDAQARDVAAEDSPAQVPPPESRANKRLLTLAFGMLAAILIGGALFLTLVVLWGNRARRLARSQLPPVSKQDELWFLKPKKNAGDPDEPEGQMPPGPTPGSPGPTE